MSVNFDYGESYEQSDWYNKNEGRKDDDNDFYGA